MGNAFFGDRDSLGLARRMECFLANSGGGDFLFRNHLILRALFGTEFSRSQAEIRRSWFRVWALVIGTGFATI